MKRRRFVQALAAAPAVPVLLAQQVAPPATTQQPAVNPQMVPGGARGGFGSMEDLQKLDVVSPDDAASMVQRFFTADQFSALQKLSDTMMPAMKGMPGALEAKAPEFLDFLIGHSLADRQQVYKLGLDALNAQSRKSFSKTFATLESSQITELLTPPLKRPWTYDPPADPLERFLRAFKADVRTATTNSKEYSVAAAANGGGGAGGGRRGGGGGGLGLYWNSLD